MAGGRPKAELVLTDEERETLQRWARRPKSSQFLALRSRIVLACGRGWSNTQVSRNLSVTMPTVGQWRKRFVERRLDGLLDEPRPGAPRKISDADVEWVVTQTLESKPPPATHGSTRGMAKASGLSQSAVSRIWRAFGLQPQRTETFKLSTDPLFIDKVRDVVGLSLSPPDNAIVLGLDEKSQVQALDRTPPLLPLEPGRPERPTHDYARHGTTSLFAAWNVATGQVIGRCHQRAPAPGVPQIPGSDRPDHSRRARRRDSPGHGPLRHPQNPAGQALAGQATAVSCAFHPHECVLTQPGRTVLRRDH